MLLLVALAFPPGMVTDPRVWLILLLLGGAALGRSGVIPPGFLDLLKPWRTRPRSQPGRTPPPSAATARGASSPLRDPLFLLLLVVAAAGTAAWVVMKLTVTAGRA